MTYEVLITLTRSKLEDVFPEQDDQEKERLDYFRQTGDLSDFFITRSDDDLVMIVHYVFDDEKEAKIVTRDPVILAIREEWQAVCYENQISYSLSTTKNNVEKS